MDRSSKTRAGAVCLAFVVAQPAIQLKPSSFTARASCPLRSPHQQRTICRSGIAVHPYRPFPITACTNPSSSTAAQSNDLPSDKSDAAARPRRRQQSQPLSCVTYTFLQNNSFALNYGDKTLLIDPWLTGDLVFATPKFFRSTKRRAENATHDPANFDMSAVSAIVLTQGLPDHAHVPTLERLSRNIPIIAAPDAVPVVTNLGFLNVSELRPGGCAYLSSRPFVSVTGAKGAIVGPPWSAPQLAVLFSFAPDASSLPTREEQHAQERHHRTSFLIYHEPHGCHDAPFLKMYKARLDAVITPVVSSTIPVLNNYTLVNGVDNAVQLCQAARPTTCVTFDNSADGMSGFLANYVVSEGGLSAFREAVAHDGTLSDMNIIGDAPVMRDVIIAGEGVGSLLNE